MNIDLHEHIYKVQAYRTYQEKMNQNMTNAIHATHTPMQHLMHPYIFFPSELQRIAIFFSFLYFFASVPLNDLYIHRKYDKPNSAKGPS